MNVEKPVHAGAFRTIAAADAAVEGLVEAGFARDSITVIAPKSIEEHFEAERVDVEKPSGSHTPQGVAAGGAVGLLAGAVTTAVVAATGGAPLLVAGPLFGAGVVVGGFIGAMMTRGMEHEVADYYDQALRRGAILVAVEAPEGSPEAQAAKRVFETSGAEPVDLKKT